jgi:hypothetical protein
MEWYWWLVIIPVIYWIVAYSKKRKRYKYLLAKYKDEKLVARIVKGSVWQGQTREQLWDALGKPLDVDEKVLKSKTKETWKYKEIGKKRYAFRVFIENNEVVGWEQK